MPPIFAEIHSRSNSLHLQQLYAGFSLLKKSGVVRIEQKISRENLFDAAARPHLREAREHHLKVVVNQKKQLYYDLHDSGEIDENALAESDFYFKRSFSPNHIASLADGAKIFPYGLNYLIYTDEADKLLAARHILHDTLREQIETNIRGLKLEKLLANKIFTPRVSQMSAAPDFTVAPRALFMARTWRPAEAEDAAIQETIAEMNERRAAAIRLLRKTFGARFFGGFSHEDYAVKHFPDCLLPDNFLSKKSRYLQLLREFPICVATEGLLGSNGWKLAEYVAFAKAIVSEPLKFQVPGNFSAAQNYLAFQTPDELAAQIEKLFSDDQLRFEIMKNNADYYQHFLRPDALVLNTLKMALEKSDFGQ